MKRFGIFTITWTFLLSQYFAPAMLAGQEAGNEAIAFKVGIGKRNITPKAGLPMWGYGDRHALPARGVLDSLYAKAIVITTPQAKLAMVGLDLGRAPTRSMMQKIRRDIRLKAGIEHVLISGSHTHHAPVIELTNQEGMGKGTFDQAVAYSQQLPDLITAAILEAADHARPARMGVTSREVDLNRNRHTKRQPKPTDPDLIVLRFDDLQGKPLAVLVNYAAHPVLTDPKILKYSADYPGFLQKKVEAELATNCVFIQGAAGDLTPRPINGQRDPEVYGEHLAEQVIELANEIQSGVPEKPAIMGKVDEFVFNSRIDFSNPVLEAAYAQAFFPELVRAYFADNRNGIHAELNTILLNHEIAMVGGSGEFFCNHANRLKDRLYVKQTLFFGYCNGHNLYYPTIEAASEGGYGADAKVSHVELGAGEKMMDQALINIYSWLGKFKGLELAK